MASTTATPLGEMGPWFGDQAFNIGPYFFRSATTDEELCAANPTEVFCIFPALAPLYTSWEKRFVGVPSAKWCYDRPWIPFVFVIAYLIFLKVGPAYMKDKPAFRVQKLLAAWNLGLSVFSTIGAMRTVPTLLFHLLTRGPHYTVCQDANTWFGNGVVGFWALSFVLSKIPELVDTVFIVIRKRKLIFLHWYHHTTVLLLCWYGGATRQSAAIWFMSMNYSVHSIMYFYYYLSAIGRRVSWAHLVTTMQISQMFMGMLICAKVELARWRSLPCGITPGCHFLASGIYLSYFYLFCHFAYFRFIAPRPRKGSSSRKPKPGAATGGKPLEGLPPGVAAGVEQLKHRVKGSESTVVDMGGVAGATNGEGAHGGSATPHRGGGTVSVASAGGVDTNMMPDSHAQAVRRKRED